MTPGKPHQVEIDKAQLAEWIEWGFSEMAAYLENQAAFTQYLETHKKEQAP